MFPCLAFSSGYWWTVPLIMIAMMVLCFFMMKRHGGPMICCPGFGKSGGHSENESTRPLDILNGQNAQGEINNREYEKKKEDVVRRT